MPLMFIARPQPCYNQIMKAILVDALDGIINSDGTLFQEMYELLEQYPNRKIIVTNANDQQFNQFNFRIAPYEIFTLKHNPDKVDPARGSARSRREFHAKERQVLLWLQASRGSGS